MTRSSDETAVLRPSAATRPIRRRRSGAIFALIGILALPLLAMVGLAVDVGAAQVTHARLSHAAQAAERAGSVLLANTGGTCSAMLPRLETLAIDIQDMHVGETLMGNDPQPPEVRCDTGEPVVTTSMRLEMTFPKLLN